jgi:lipopolysaccharide export system permease protein
MKLTLHKYIFHEIWPTFLTIITVFAFIVVGTRMLSLAELVINRGVDLRQVLKLILYLLPGIVLFALPAAALMAVFIAFIRLSSDNEILALKSSGISLFQMLPSVFFVSFVSFLIAMFLAVFGAPRANGSFKDIVFQIAQSKADLAIKERVFCEPFANVTFYINSFSSREGVMKDVFVVDRRDPQTTNTIVAKEARVASNPTKRTITIGFLNGTIFMVDADFQSSRTLKFDTYTLNIGLQDILRAISSRKKSPKEMSIQELRDSLKKETKGEVNYNETLIELLEKLSIPLAVFLMGFIGIPLGAQLKAGGRSVGVVVGVIIFLIYYMFLGGVRSLCETGAVSPLVGVWLPDLFLLLSSLYLWNRASKDRSINILERMKLKWESRERASYGMGNGMGKGI